MPKLDIGPKTAAEITQRNARRKTKFAPGTWGEIGAKYQQRIGKEQEPIALAALLRLGYIAPQDITTGPQRTLFDDGGTDGESAAKLLESGAARYEYQPLTQSLGDALVNGQIQPGAGLKNQFGAALTKFRFDYAISTGDQAPYDDYPTSAELMQMAALAGERNGTRAPSMMAESYAKQVETRRRAEARWALGGNNTATAVPGIVPGADPRGIAQSAVSLGGDAVVRRLIEIKQAWPSIHPRVAYVLAAAGYGLDSEATMRVVFTGMSAAIDPGKVGANQRLRDEQAKWVKQQAAEPQTDLRQSPVGVDLEKRKASLAGAGFATQPDGNSLWDVVKEGVGLLDDGAQAVPEALDFAYEQLLKPIVRTAAVALQTPWELVSGGVPRSVLAGVISAQDIAKTKNILATNGSTPELPSGARWHAGQGYNPLAQTLGGVAAEHILEGERPQLGTGLFPDLESPDAIEQARRTRATLSVAGGLLDKPQGWTIGRGAMSVVTPPGTTEYNVLSGLVDASLLLAFDPANFAIGKWSNLRAAAKVLSPHVVAEGIEGAGIINAVRRSITPMTARQFLDSDRGVKLVDLLATNKLSFRQVFEVVGGNAETAGRVFMADTPTAVRTALEDVLGLSLRTKPKPAFMVRSFGAAGETLASKIPGVRYLGESMPHSFDPSNMDDALEQIWRRARTAHIPADEANDFLLSYLTAPGREARYQVLTEFGKAQAARVTGNSPFGLALKAQLGHVFGDVDAIRLYEIDNAGQSILPPWWILNGSVVESVQPGLIIDFLRGNVPAFRSRDLRHMTSVLGPFYETKVGQTILGAENAAAAFTNTLWKPFTLLRGAWMIRVIPEEQWRMAMSGYESMFSHPLSYFAWLTGRKTNVRGFSFLDEAYDLARKGDPAQYLDALSGDIRRMFYDPTGAAVKSRHYVKQGPEGPAFVEAWAQELGRYHADPAIRQVARLGPDEAKNWLWDTPLGQQLRAELHEATRGAVPHGVTPTPGFDILNNRASSDQWIDEVVSPSIERLTQGREELRGVLANNKLNGEVVWGVSMGGAPKLSQGARATLTQLMDDGLAPSNVVREVVETEGSKGKMSGFMNGLFRVFMGIETDALSRSVTFRQAYWNRIEELLPYMSPADRAQAIANAERMFGRKVSDVDATVTMSGLSAADQRRVKKYVSIGQDMGTDELLQSLIEAKRTANSTTMDDLSDLISLVSKSSSQRSGQVLSTVARGKKQIEKLRAAAAHDAADLPTRPHKVKTTNPDGSVTSVTETGPHYIGIKEADTLAKQHGLDSTRDLLYDLHDRSQVFDILRVVFPFGEAWREMITRWSKILVEHPESIRKSEMVLEGARDSGVFHEDPTTGQEVFSFFGVDSLAGWGIGTPVGMSGNVKGLNLIGTGMPGFGPAIQVPMSWLTADRLETDSQLYRMLYPAGTPDARLAPGQAFLEAILPPWSDKVASWWKDDPASDRMMATAFGRAMAYHRSTGKFGYTESEIRRLADVARDDAGKSTLLRGIVQFFAPAAPQMVWPVETTKGKQNLSLLMNELYSSGGKDYAVKQTQFVEKYGIGAYAATQALSWSVGSAPPLSPTGADWVRDHSEIATKFPWVYGFFAPRKKNESIDLDYLNDQVQRGERVGLFAVDPSGVTFGRAMNSRIGTFLYYSVRDLLPAQLSPGQQDATTEYRNSLIKQYPGFGSVAGVPGEPDPDEVIAQLRQAVQAPAIRNGGVAKAVREYLVVRDAALDKLRGAAGDSGSTLYSRRAQPLRVILDQQRAILTKQYPGFHPIATSIFRRDFEELDNG